VTTFATLVPRARVGNKLATGVCAGKRHSCALFQDGTVRFRTERRCSALAACPCELTLAACPCGQAALQAQRCSNPLAQVACVGGNGNGQLGRGTSGSTPLPDWGFVAGITNAVDVECGELSTCVLHKDGKVSCWGLALAVGTGSSTGISTTPQVTISSGALAVALGDQHGCAIINDGTVKCWCVSRDLGAGGMEAVGLGRAACALHSTHASKDGLVYLPPGQAVTL
jgi:alpha-tubulin suppressor-like RCC1 family protein